MANILDQFPEVKKRTIDEHAYRMVVTQNSELGDYETFNIALAFALSQRRSEQRRKTKKRSKRAKTQG